MRDSTIVIRKSGDSLITVARSAPVESTIIVKQKGYIIETVSVLKNQESDLLGTSPTTPRVAPSVTNYWTLNTKDPVWSQIIEVSAYILNPFWDAILAK